MRLARQVLLLAALATAVTPLGAAAPAAAPKAAAPAPKADPPADLRVEPPPQTSIRARVAVARARDFTRLTIDGPVTPTARVDGQTVLIRFGRPVAADLAALMGPTRFIADVGRRQDAGGTVIELRLADGAGATARRDGRSLILDVGPKPPAEAPPPASVEAAAQPAAQPAAEPAAELGAPTAVTLQAGLVGRDVELAFRFNAPAAAAVFRRGDTVWVLFPYDLPVDAGALSGLGSRLGRAETVRAPGVTGLRFATALNPAVAGSGQTWLIRFAQAPGAVGKALEVRRQSAPTGGGRLEVAAPSAQAVRWIDDPLVGDRLAVGFMAGPASSLPRSQTYLQASFPPTTHGVVMAPRADGVDMRRDVAGFAVVSDAGLTLSPEGVGGPGGAVVAMEPGFVDFEAWRMGPREAFPALHAQAMRAAAMESLEDDAPVRARLDLIRFLLAWELAPEALGAVRTLIQEEPEQENQAEVRALRGVARAMMGRWAEARADLGSPGLLQTGSAQAWAAYAAAGAEDWPEAKRLFDAHARAIDGFADDWRARLRTAYALAAVRMGDLDAARTQSRKAVAEAASDPVRADALLADAETLAATGRRSGALKVYRALAATPYGPVAARAALEAAGLGVALGDLDPAKAIEAYDAMRFSWRGDEVEIEVLRRLSGLYFAQGQTREALSTLRGAATLRPELEAARRLREDLATAFRGLFVDGRADAMEPLEALALFYDFRDLTPIGPDGDRTVRALVDRLVAFDLLPQAAELLQHQVSHRFEGAARAAVATDLAAIYLMDRKPEQALKAIADSRITGLPGALNQQRRLIQAAALSDLKRPDHALEIIEDDRSIDAARLRAEIAWQAQDWPRAAAGLRAALPPAGDLSPEQAMDVLRAATAASLAGDQAGVRALRARFGAAMARTAEADSFAAVAAPPAEGGGDIRAVVARLADVSPYDTLLKRVRQRVNDQAAPTDPRAGAFTRRTEAQLSAPPPGVRTDADARAPAVRG